MGLTILARIMSTITSALTDRSQRVEYDSTLRERTAKAGGWPIDLHIPAHQLAALSLECHLDIYPLGSVVHPSSDACATYQIRFVGQGRCNDGAITSINGSLHQRHLYVFGFLAETLFRSSTFFFPLYLA